MNQQTLHPTHYAAGTTAPVLHFILGSFEQPVTVARELFRALRMVDEAGVQAVVVEGVRDCDEGLAVMNRLRKAATRVIRPGH